MTYAFMQSISWTKNNSYPMVSSPGSAGTSGVLYSLFRSGPWKTVGDSHKVATETG